MTERRDGFTLLEVTLAMSALAMLVAICYGAFHVGIRAVESGEMAVVTAQRLRVATDVLIRQLKSAVHYPVRTADDNVYWYFTGTATSLTFITAAAQQGGGGLARVVYRLEEDPKRLVLEESPFFSPDTLGADPVDKPGDRAVVLLDGFQSIKFQYCVNDGAEPECEWRDGWDGPTDGEDMMPAAVRIVVTGLPGLELNVWGQEIPIMAMAYGEEQPDPDELLSSGGDGGDGGEGDVGGDGDMGGETDDGGG